MAYEAANDPSACDRRQALDRLSNHFLFLVRDFMWLG